MFKYDEFTGPSARGIAGRPPPFGAGMLPEIAAKTERIEVWCSEFKDPGEDWTEFRAFDKENVEIGRERRAGY